MIGFSGKLDVGSMSHFWFEPLISDGPDEGFKFCQISLAVFVVACDSISPQRYRFWNERSGISVLPAMCFSCDCLSKFMFGDLGFRWVIGFLVLGSRQTCCHVKTESEKDVYSYILFHHHQPTPQLASTRSILTSMIAHCLPSSHTPSMKSFEVRQIQDSKSRGWCRILLF